MGKVFVTMLRRLERSINTRQAYKLFLRDWLSLTDLQSCAQVVSTMRFTRTLEPLEMSSPQGKRITVIAPHPDDEMLGAGGTLIRARKGGASVRCIYLTSSKPPTQVEAETAEVAQRIGYRTESLRYPVHAIPLSDDSVTPDSARHWPPSQWIVSLCRFCSTITTIIGEQISSCGNAWRRGLVRDDIGVWCYQVYSPIISNVVVDISDVAEERPLPCECGSRKCSTGTSITTSWDSTRSTSDCFPRHTLTGGSRGQLQESVTTGIHQIMEASRPRVKGHWALFS